MRRLGRYALVGAIATAVHYGLLTLLVEVFGVPAWLASGIGAVAGAQVAFVGNRWFTFAHAGLVAPAWVRFQSTAAAGAVLGMVIVGAGVQWGLYYLFAQVLATVAGMLLTFAINRAWTFR